MLFETKKIKITQNGIYILDKTIQQAIDKKKLSASLINSWLIAPADWVLDTYIFPEVKKEDTPHLLRGNWYHETMEHFYQLEEKDRTVDNLLKVAETVTAETDKPESKKMGYANFSLNEENKEWYKKALLSYCKTWLPNAKSERIATLFVQGKNKKGLELFVSGKIGNAQRSVLGFIDKIVEGENGLKVQDWKTGKTIENFNPTKKISQSNSFDYWRQQTLYSLLLEQQGAVIESASLLFPCTDTPTEIFVDQANQDVRLQVIKDVEQVDKEYTEAINNNYFYPFKKHKYANWSSWLGGLGNAPKPNILEDKFLMVSEVE